MARFSFALAVLLVAVAVAVRGTAAVYDKDGPVQLLSPKGFRTVVLNSDLPALVEFYAPWCGHCQQLAPTYKKVAQNLEGIVNVVAVDCDSGSNKQLCAEYGVKGFPTIKLFPVDKQKNPYTGTLSKTPVDYNGPRSARDLVSAATAALPDTLITKVTGTAEQEKWHYQNTLNKVLLFTSKDQSTPLYKSLSLRYKDRLMFAEAHDSDTELMKMFQVEQTPLLLLLTPDGARVPYGGKLKATKLFEFLDIFAEKLPEDKSDPDSETAQPEKKKKQELEMKWVVDMLNLTAFDDILEKEDAWLVGLYSETLGECAAQTVTFNKVANELGPVVKFGLLNTLDLAPADLDSRQLAGIMDPDQPCQLQLLLLPFGDKTDADTFEKYSGPMAAKELQAFILTAFPDNVMRVTSATYQQYFSLTEGAKVILYTNKAETPPIFCALANNLRGLGLNFVDIHESEKELMAQVKVPKVPHLMVAYAPPPGDDSANQPKGGLRVQHYPGPLKFKHMAAFLTEFASFLQGWEGEGKADGGAGTGAAGSAEVPEVGTNAAMEEHCTSRLGLCVIGLLDSSSQGFSQELELFKEVAGSRGGQPLSFVWVEAPRQQQFLAAFDLGPQSAPGVLVLSAKKLRYAQLQGGFTKARIIELLDGMLAGKERVLPFLAMPQLVDGGEDLDAAGGAEEVEEEFDLSDIMAEQVEGADVLVTKEEQLKRVEAQLKTEAEAKRKAEEEAAAAAKAEKAAKKAQRKQEKAAAKAAAAEAKKAADAQADKDEL